MYAKLRTGLEEKEEEGKEEGDVKEMNLVRFLLFVSWVCLASPLLSHFIFYLCLDIRGT